MDMPETASKKHTFSWITSLAISVTCCAVQFIVFAGYIFDLKEDIAATRIRFDILEQRVNSMNVEIDNLRHHPDVQKIQILPPPNGAPPEAPLSIVPDTQPAGAPAAPAAATPTQSPAAMPNSAPVVTPSIVPPAETPKPVPPTPTKH